MRKTGIIERLEPDGGGGFVAWGAFEDGQTFDLPSFGYPVGTEVWLSEADNPESDEYDYCTILVGERVATAIFCEHTEEGMEIVHVEQYEKAVN